MRQPGNRDRLRAAGLTARKRAIGVAGTAARVVVGLALLGSVMTGELTRGWRPAAWVLALLVFPGAALDFTSDAALIFYGASMLLAAARGYAGCEVFAAPNWLLCRDDQVGCVLFAPVDALERRVWPGWHSTGPFSRL